MTKSDCPDMGEVSDGYHTFNELYEHRCLLFLALCAASDSDDCAWVADHYPGWDCVFLWTDCGQISYHVPAKYRAAYVHCRQEQESPWDGHTSADVIERLKRSLRL